MLANPSMYPNCLQPLLLEVLSNLFCQGVVILESTLVLRLHSISDIVPSTPKARQKPSIKKGEYCALNSLKL